MFLSFWAKPTPPDPHLLANLARFVVPVAIITGGFATAVYAFLLESVTEFLGSGRTPAEVISDFESYTGLAYTDADFTEAAATIGAQTGLDLHLPRLVQDRDEGGEERGDRYRLLDRIRGLDV